MNSILSLLLQYLTLAPRAEVANRLLCHGVGRYLSYIPISDELLPIGELEAPCKSIDAKH